MRKNGTAKQLDCEKTKERCETAKGRCETTKLRNFETAMRNIERVMRNNETAKKTKVRKAVLHSFSVLCPILRVAVQGSI